jgi:hypothetical protein
MDPKEEKFLNIYCIPVVLYLGKCIIVHEGRLQLAHPILQLTHDIIIHNSGLIYNYSVSLHNDSIFNKTMLFRKEFIKHILNSHLGNSAKNGLYEFLFEILHELNNIGILLTRIKPKGMKYHGHGQFDDIYFDRDEYDQIMESYQICDDYLLNPILLYAISKFIPKVIQYRNIPVSFVYFIDDGKEFEYDNFNYISECLASAFQIVYGQEIPLLNFYIKESEINVNSLEHYNNLNTYKHGNVTGKKIKLSRKVFITDDLSMIHQTVANTKGRVDGLRFTNFNDLFK